MLKIEVVYVTKDKFLFQLRMEVPEGSTVEDALLKSNIYSLHPETNTLALGIYAKKVSLETKLKEGDRIELYRPLFLDPKEKRRRNCSR